MSDANAHEATPLPDASAARKRKGPPAWGVVLFLVLLGGMVILNQSASRSGPPIQWVDNDLEAALKQVGPQRPRVFLYVYDPNDKVHQRNEREIFAQKWAKDTLASAVCCRVAIGQRGSQEVVTRYQYRGTPLFLLLTKSGEKLFRAEGALSELEFLTSIGRPAQQAQRNAASEQEP